MKTLSTTRILASTSLFLLLSTLPAFSADREKREPNEPSFSADGTRLVYREDVVKAGEVLPSTKKIWIVNCDGTGARALTHGAKDSHPRFSPDGKSVAFSRDGDIWAVSVGGGAPRNLTNTPAALETQAEFTLRGDLVFLRETPEKLSQAAQQALVKDPWLAIGLKGVQSVVWHQMSDHQERAIVGDGYEVLQLEPNPVFDDAVFLVCRPLDNDGKPVGEITQDKVIAVAKLDGTLPRTVFAPRPEDKIELQELHIRNDLNFVVARWPGNAVASVALLKDGKIEPLPEAPIFGDISRDGKTIAGTGIVYGQNSLFGLVLYDIATKTRRQVMVTTK